MSLFYRLDEESNSSTSGSSIVFENSECSKDRKGQSTNVQINSSNDVLTSAVAKEQRSQVLSTNFVPCVFLGEPRSVRETCPALRWESSTLSEESYVDMTSQHLAEKHPKEACCSSFSKKNAGNAKSSVMFIFLHSFHLIFILQVQFHLMLYIQMQLCERSLKEWIQERNSKTDLTESTGKLNGLLIGIGYLHCIIGCDYFFVRLCL